MDKYLSSFKMVSISPHHLFSYISAEVPFRTISPTAPEDASGSRCGTLSFWVQNTRNFSDNKCLHLTAEIFYTSSISPGTYQLLSENLTLIPFIPFRIKNIPVFHF